MSRLRTFCCCVGVALLVVLLAGCEQKLPTLERPETYTTSVGGVVTLNGEPLADASVLFIPIVYAHRQQARIPVAFGKTDSEGNYHLSYLMEDGMRSGAHLGRCKVLVSKLEVSDQSPEKAPSFIRWGFHHELDPFRAVPRPPSPSQEQLPVRYNLDSELTAEISSTDEVILDFHFEK